MKNTKYFYFTFLNHPLCEQLPFGVSLCNNLQSSQVGLLGYRVNSQDLVEEGVTAALDLLNLGTQTGIWGQSPGFPQGWHLGVSSTF